MQRAYTIYIDDYNQTEGSCGGGLTLPAWDGPSLLTKLEMAMIDEHAHISSPVYEYVLAHWAGHDPFSKPAIVFRNGVSTDVKKKKGQQANFFWIGK